MGIYGEELKRMWRTIGLYISLLVGCVIVIMHWVQYVLPYAKTINTNPDYSRGMIVYPVNAFTNWIGGTDTMYSKLLFLLLPMLVTLPYAVSFYQDCKNGYINYVCTRTSQKSYFQAKFLAVFLSGGIVSVIPLLLNFILSATVMPCIKVEAAAGAGFVLPKSSFSKIFFQHPFLFNLICLVMVFVFAGTLAVFALATTFYSKYIYTPMLFPFILCLVIMAFADLIQHYEWQPMNFLSPAYSSPRLVSFFVTTGILLFISWWEFLFRGKKQDVL